MHQDWLASHVSSDVGEAQQPTDPELRIAVDHRYQYVDSQPAQPSGPLTWILRRHHVFHAGLLETHAATSVYLCPDPSRGFVTPSRRPRKHQYPRVPNQHSGTAERFSFSMSAWFRRSIPTRPRIPLFDGYYKRSPATCSHGQFRRGVNLLNGFNYTADRISASNSNRPYHNNGISAPGERCLGQTRSPPTL